MDIDDAKTTKSIDPYEEKLFSLFNSFCCANNSLNRENLEKLCTTLQLKERGQLLLNLLLTDTKLSVTFKEFREGLLQVITDNETVAVTVQTTTTTATAAVTTTVTTPIKAIKTSVDDLELSDREISPKLIVGTKKYGRRSRPAQSGDDTSDSDNEAIVPSVDGKKVHRSVSQSEVHGGKRRRPIYATKLKRCASLPSHKRLDIKVRQQQQHQHEINENSVDEDGSLKSKKTSMNSLAQNLRAVWNSFVPGADDCINFAQLEVVCEKVGLHKIAAKLAAEEVFEKLSIKQHDGIRFNEFMNLLQSDSDMFSSVENIGHITGGGIEIKMSESKTDEDEGQIYHEVVPGWSTESGSLAAVTLVDLWETAGINDAEKLLHNLGFFAKEVKIPDLCNVLEEEIQRQNNDEMLSVLLKASLTLHRAEITSLRQSFRQLVDENRKLFSDNKEANRRASILAQEIDERHTNLEDSTRSEIKSIEQRHNETIKELTMQLALEREQLSQLNTKLESKIKSMEVEEVKLRSDFAGLREENSALESEQTELHKQITDMLEQNIKLNQEIAEMESSGSDDAKNDCHNEEMLDLIEKIETLQMENSNLRDKNDELQSDIENLNGEVVRWKGKSKYVGNKSQEHSGAEDQEANISSAIKRRGDSPSKIRAAEESPRMGKVRKFSEDNESETSGDWMALNNELASSTPAPSKAIAYAFHNRDEEIDQLKRKVLDLELSLSEYQNKTSDMTSKLSESGAHEVSFKSNEELRKEKDKFQARVKELEASLELMSREYENCEDYWQAKVNDERMLFDEEQRLSDEKFAELLQKMTELEDQFAAQNDRGGRLSPIDENQLEQQYLELENEMEDLKVHAQTLLDDKAREIECLQLEVSHLQENLEQSIVIKTTPRVASPESIASSPINYLLNQNTITGPIRDYQNPNYQARKSEEKMDEPINKDQEFSKIISPIQKPQSLNTNQQSLAAAQVIAETNREMLEVCEALSIISAKSIGSNSLHSLQEMQNSRSSSPISVSTAKDNIKKLKRIMGQMKEEITELATQRESLIMELQQLQEAKPILANAYKTTHPNLAQKLEKMQLKNKQLQNVLKQQQHYTENIMYQTWHQQRQELNELRNRLEAQSIVISEQATRLASADLLVKDLYVENSHLTASIQRMEQQMTRQTLMHLAQHHAPQQQQMGNPYGMPGMP